MQDFINKKIVLGICGGIAAYKSAYLVRELTQAGAWVRVVMTESARKFITPLTFQGLSGNEVRTDLFDSEAERAMGHIELARWADYLVIAPATANCLAKMAHGLADDLLSTLYLVATIPVIVCPAMNHSMWSHPATRENCDRLKRRGVIFVAPEEGSQACGEYGVGRLAEYAQIMSALRLCDMRRCLVGQHVLITAGPTREAIDPVRYLSNRSSGKMGYALATAAVMAGACVTLVSGPCWLPKPAGVTFYSVDTAQAMFDVVMQQLKPGMIFIATAAVADFSVPTCFENKIKKEGNAALALTLMPNPDILATVASSKLASFVVGFAAETTRAVEFATNKLYAKQADMIIANQVGTGVGFDADENEVTIVTKDKQISLPCMNKTRLAGNLIAMIAETMQTNAKIVEENRE